MQSRSMPAKAIFLFFCLFGFPSLAQAQEAALDRMYSAVRQTHKVSFKFRSFERMDKGSSSSLSEKLLNVDMTTRPLKIEINMIEPNKGTRVLYDETKKSSYVTVYIDLKLATVPKDFYIHGNTIMANTHHPITATGFVPIVNLMKAAEEKARKEGRYEKVFADKGITNFDGRSCRKIEVFDEGYGFTSYTAKKGETVLSIAAKQNLSAYKIMQLNPDLSKTYDDIGGKTIKVPNSYAKYVLLYIDTQTQLPYMTEVHDDKGLFEKYYFLNVKK